MRSIDLSESYVLEVKRGDVIYRLRDPKVSEIESFEKAFSKGEKGAFDTLLISIGLPKEVCEDLGVVAKKRITEALTETLVDKKKSD
jgi:hypothetical protein